MDAKALPRLRPLEILRLSEEEDASYLLRDPEGYSDEELVLSEPALFVAAHADGEHTLDQLRESFARRYGDAPDENQIKDLLDRLGAAYMLETDAFHERRHRLHEDFHTAPTRPATHDGICYPAGTDEAVLALESFYEKATTLEEEGDRPGGRLRGLVTPHIDLRVGGPASALAYRLLDEAPEAETVFVLGTAHGCPHPSWIVLEKPYETPLGTVPVNEEACRRLAEAAGTPTDDLYYHRKEHSVEFQAVFLAWLRRMKRNLEIVPVLCGSLRVLDGEEPQEPVPPIVGEDPFLVELARLVEEHGDTAIVVAGADLAHVGPRFGDSEPLDEEHLKLLEKKDRQTLEAVVRGDPRAFFTSVTEAGDPRRICGLSPIYGALAVLPGVLGKVLRYEQAVDSTGTVTYASVGLWG
jgi:AmmeMemoRadiSam system protein B